MNEAETHAGLIALVLKAARRGHACNAGALTFHRFSARRKCGEHGAHGDGLCFLRNR
jgi:hypothetical protein